MQFDGGVNGALRSNPPPGREDPELVLGLTYRYELRRANNYAALLASVTVTTHEVQATLAENIVQDLVGLAALPPPPQQIFNLTVTPGIDRVRISFRTTQPTIPQITCKGTDGSTNVALALLNGLQTKHTCTFGENSPLPQDMQHTFTIVAAGQTFNGTAKDTFAHGLFRTGSRHATVIFDRIKVRNDSDKLSAGEIAFSFLRGRCGHRRLTGLPRPWPVLWRHEQLISDEDPPVDVNLSILMEKAPRRVWVNVAGLRARFFRFLGASSTCVHVIQVGVPGTSGKSDVSGGLCPGDGRVRHRRHHRS